MKLMLLYENRQTNEDKTIMLVYVKKSEHIPWCLLL